MINFVGGKKVYSCLNKVPSSLSEEEYVGTKVSSRNILKKSSMATSFGGPRVRPVLPVQGAGLILLRELKSSPCHN